MSAGKNTYTYDAHTYHTKVPPQGIAELLKHYLPEGGLVLDPFSGSGMTGVAATSLGLDCILNELSPAAGFISSRFVSSVDASEFASAVQAVVDALETLRADLYTTTCRECQSDTELLYAVWSYEVICSGCEKDFQLWDVCRKYGRTVRDHKILPEFNCPHCGLLLKKSRLERTVAVPVEVAYKCCGSKQKEVTHPPSDEDLAVLRSTRQKYPPLEGFYPEVELPAGVNLGQPRRHGLTTVKSFYTDRGLTVMSHLWRQIHRIEDPQIAAHVAFVFTGLYRRVTRLSEFRFWGGSGNTARLNVPYIFEESNIFHVFLRKARAVQDHLETAALTYQGRTVVRVGSATDMNWLPDESVDLVFTDPPFGGNINYSEMNLLWESWLGRFTNNAEEAIVNKVQGKDVADYGSLMRRSFEEAYRVLRPGHWMLVMFMNSSARVWEELRDAIDSAGFAMVSADIFDKQHGTFKQFVSENAAGADLVIHCLKPAAPLDSSSSRRRDQQTNGVHEFLDGIDLDRYRQSFLHVPRDSEVDYRRLYSEWLTTALDGGPMLDFAEFRRLVDTHGSSVAITPAGEE
jgi:DNA modification methylase